MVRRVLAIAVGLLAMSGGEAWAHASLQGSEPAAGATLGAAPRVLRLTFTERPDPALSVVRVLGRDGAPRQTGTVAAVAGDPRTLAVGVRPLPAGIYTVRFRAVAAGDGHVSSGVVTFGVRRTPGAAAIARSAGGGAEPLEVAARIALIAGLIALLGGAAAAAARFGGAGGSDGRLAAGGCAVALCGLIGLAVAQAEETGVSVTALLDGGTGRGLLWRAAGLLGAGAALLLARQLPRLRRALLGGAALAALVAMGAEAASGHAGTSAARVGFQLVHFGAGGIWLGGLAALLLGVRGAPSSQKAAAVRRFSRLAAAALALVCTTGALRAVEELPRATDLLTSDYGRTILVKTLLVLVVIVVAWRNRTRSVPAAAHDLRPLRRRSRVELAAAAGALMAAGMLGSIAPPVVAHAPAPALSASGSDPAHTIRVQLAAASPEPGPNAFVARLRDPAGDPAEGVRGIRLRFTALDDPDVAPTTLTLRRGPRDQWVGTGGNLRFDGRWGIEVLVARRAATVVVPLELTARAPKQFLSVLRVPGRAPAFTRFVKGLGYLRVSPHPRRSGASRLLITAFDIFEGEAHVKRLALTTTRDGITRRHPVRRLGPGRFAAHVEPEETQLAVVARRTDGSRMRSTFEVP